MIGLSSLIACQVAAFAAVVTGAALDLPTSFAAGAWRVPTEEDDLQFLDNPINARGGKFFINQVASTYCPEGVSGLDCTAFPGPGTSFGMGEGSTSMGLDVTVPGGQLVYIGPDGSLSYTQAHSAYIPAGSLTIGFSRRIGPELGQPVYLEFEGQSWYLCPTSEGAATERTYQVFAFPEVPDNDECVLTQIRTFNYDGGKVWQYI